MGAVHLTTLGRLAGTRFPLPAFCDLLDPEPVVARLLAVKRQHQEVLLTTFVSSAVRLALPSTYGSNKSQLFEAGPEQKAERGRRMAKAPDWTEEEFSTLLDCPTCSDEELAQRLDRRSAGAVGVVRAFLHHFPYRRGRPTALGVDAARTQAAAGIDNLPVVPGPVLSRHDTTRLYLSGRDV
jgi:hypothetical protein